MVLLSDSEGNKLNIKRVLLLLLTSTVYLQSSNFAFAEQRSYPPNKYAHVLDGNLKVASVDCTFVCGNVPQPYRGDISTFYNAEASGNPSVMTEAAFKNQLARNTRLTWFLAAKIALASGERALTEQYLEKSLNSEYHCAKFSNIMFTEKDVCWDYALNTNLDGLRTEALKFYVKKFGWYVSDIGSPNIEVPVVTQPFKYGLVVSTYPDFFSSLLEDAPQSVKKKFFELNGYTQELQAFSDVYKDFLKSQQSISDTLQVTESEVPPPSDFVAPGSQRIITPKAKTTTNKPAKQTAPRQSNPPPKAPPTNPFK